MEACPAGKEVSEFQFKLFSTIRVFPSIDFQQNFKNQSNTIAVSNKLGIIIVGTPTGFQIVNLAKFISPDSTGKFSEECTDYPRREYSINAQPSHILLNCDETLMAVAVQQPDDSPLVRIYKMASLTSQSKNRVIKLAVGAPGTFITDFSWNPVMSELLAVCISDGSLQLYEAEKKMHFLPPEKQITCVSWSPKGKQLLVGDGFGNIIQYKPDLKDPFKIVPPPSDLYPDQCSLANVIWLSVYQYGAVYINSETTETNFCIVNAPKSGEVKYISYEEICFTSGTVRPYQFYFHHLPAWNILLIASANSTEVATLSLLSDNLTWEQWLQDDSRRIDLPLDDNKSETYPVGVAIGFCSQLRISWGENIFLDPMPTLAILSNDGLISMFHIINNFPGVANLCTAPTPLPDLMFSQQNQPSTKQPVSIISTQPQMTLQPQQSTVPAAVPQSTSEHNQQSAPQPSVIQPNFFQSAGQETPPQASGTPLLLFGKSQISITPVAQTDKSSNEKPSPLSSIFQQVSQSISTYPSENMTQSTNTSAPPIQGSLFKPQPVERASPPAQVVSIPPIPPTVFISPSPTIVIDSLAKKELIKEQQLPSSKLSSAQKTGLVKKEDLDILFKLEDNINSLLKSYNVDTCSKGVCSNVGKVAAGVEQLEGFFTQLEDTVTSLTTDVCHMKQSLNEAFLYAHESKDQLDKYERKKGRDKDPADGLMICKQATNPIVEKQLLSIENNLRKATYLVRTYIQNSRPLHQHLQIVESGKSILSFQSLLESINKEKAMIAKCSLLLDEINRDVMRKCSKFGIKLLRMSQTQQTPTIQKVINTTQNDKYQSVKNQVKQKPRICTEQLQKLKSLHITQVSEPIRHLDIKLIDPKTKGLKTTDLLKLFKSPQKLPPMSNVLKSPESPAKSVESKSLSVETSSTPATPVAKKTISAATPTALFGNDIKQTVAVGYPTKPFSFGASSSTPDSNLSSTAIVIDTSKSKASATKLTFDDSVPFGGVDAKNLFTSTPAVSTSASTKLPTFSLPTSVSVAPTSSPGKIIVENPPDSSIKNMFSQESTSLFSTVKPSFAPAITVPSSTSAAPISVSFGKTVPPASSSTTFSVSGNMFAPSSSSTFSFSSTGSVGTFSFTPASSSVSSVTSSSPFSFIPQSTTSKLSFGTSTFGTGSSTSTSVSSFTGFNAPSTTSSTASSTAQVITLFSGSKPQFSSDSTASVVSSAPPSFGVTVLSPPKASTISFGLSSLDPTATCDTDKEGSVTGEDPVSSTSSKADSPSRFQTSENKTDLEKSFDKCLENISANEHPICKPASDVSVSSLQTSPLKNSSSKDKSNTTPEVKSLPLATSSETVSTPPTVSSTVSIFGSPSTSSEFSFLNAVSSATPSVFATTVTTSSSTSTEPTNKGSTLFATATPSISTESELTAPTTPVTTFVTSSISSAFSTTSASVFSSAPASPATTSVFGSPTTEVKSPQSEIGNLFGSSLSFGGSAQPAQSTGNVFGGSGAISNSGSVFGQSSSFGQSAGNIFAQKSSAPAQAGSIFGQPSATSSGSVFGQQTSSNTNAFSKPGSVFGGADSKPSAFSSSNVFGQPSAFGNVQKTEASSVFGQSTFGFATPQKVEASSSVFGQNTFGNPSAGGSVFGSPTTTSTNSSVFGQTSPFSSTSSTPFGGNTSSAFGSKSTFGQSGGSIFGASSGSVQSNFGQSGGSIFGSASGNTSGGSIFGGSPSGTGNPAFGATSTFGQKSTFGTQSAFGTSSFGAASSFGAPSAFGQPSTFGSTSPGKIFGAPEATTNTGFGAIAASGETLSFGNLAQQQSPPSGFGAFGQNNSSPSVFGAQPSFSAPQSSSFSSWR